MQHWELVNSGSIVVSNTPQELWNAACQYFKYCDDNKIETLRTLTSGKEAGRKVHIEHERPYNIKALCLHCGISEEYLRDIRQAKDTGSEYYHVVSRILYVIYVQNYELAMVGVFNPVFAGKTLNLENDDIPVGSIKVEMVAGLPALSKTENEILEKLELTAGKTEIPKEQFGNLRAE